MAARRRAVARNVPAADAVSSLFSRLAEMSPDNPDFVEYASVLADAIAESGHEQIAEHLAIAIRTGGDLPSALAYAYQRLFIPHPKMADVRYYAALAGSHYFERGISRFTGPEKYWGPYAGLYGVYFVQRNNNGTTIKRVTFYPSFGIRQVRHPHLPDHYEHVEDARDNARLMAKGDL